MEAFFENCESDRIHTKPHIPHKKAHNAIDAYAYGISYDDIVVLFDESMMGSGKSGIVITQNTIFFKEDLEKPFRIKIEEIQNIECKKGVFSKGVYINGEKVYSPTMADFKTTALVFSALANNLNAIKNMTSTPAQPEEEAMPEWAEEQPREQHFQPDAQPHIRQTLLRCNGNDGLMQGLRARSYVDTASNVVGFAISFITKTNFMGENTASEQVRKEIADTIYKIVNNIRTKNIENRAVMELKNNLATFELIVFACITLSIELQRRGMNEQGVSYLISEGLRELLGEDNYHQMAHLILEHIFDFEHLLQAQGFLCMKIFANNIAQKIVGDIEEALEYIMQPEILAFLIPNQADMPDNESDFIDAICVSVCKFMEAKMGQIIIGVEARSCVDRLMDM